MDKAIKCLEKFGKVSRASIKLSSEIEDAISELQAHKANIEELKEWYKNRRDFFMSQKEYVRAQEAEKIHQKLEGLDK